VIISLLLASVIVTSVFSVALTSKTMNGTHGRNEREQIAGQAVKEVSSALHNFVTGCCDMITGVCNEGAGVGNCGGITGPNKNVALPNDWSMNNYWLSNGPVTDSQGNVYALLGSAAGVQHCLTGVMPPWFEAAPYNAQLCYTVYKGPGYAVAAAFPVNQNFPQVTFNVNWSDPFP